MNVGTIHPMIEKDDLPLLQTTNIKHEMCMDLIVASLSCLHYTRVQHVPAGPAVEVTGWPGHLIHHCTVFSDIYHRSNAAPSPTLDYPRTIAMSVVKAPLDAREAGCLQPRFFTYACFMPSRATYETLVLRLVGLLNARCIPRRDARL